MTEALIPPLLEPLEPTKHQQQRLFFLFGEYFGDDFEQYGYENDGMFLMINSKQEVKRIHWLQLTMFDIPSRINENERNIVNLNRIPIFMRDIGKLEHPIDFLWRYWRVTYGKNRTLPPGLEPESKIGFKFGGDDYVGDC